MPIIPARCRHLHTDGRQCGSPALRDQPLCFQHTTARQPLPTKSLDDRTLPQLPAPDDFPAIQRGIAEVLRLLAEEEITDRRAATLFRGLALAGQNLARGFRHQRDQGRRQQAQGIPSQPVTDLVNDPELGPLALEPQPQTQPRQDHVRDQPGEISIQQNQDLSPFHDVFSDPADAEQYPEAASEEPVPTPAHRFTPSSGATAADEEQVGLVYMRLAESFRDKRRAFLHEKTAELEAQFQARLEAAVEARLHQLAPPSALYLTPQPELQPATA